MKTLIAYFLVFGLWSLSSFVAAMVSAVIFPIIGFLALPVGMVVFRGGVSENTMKVWNKLWAFFFFVVGGTIGYSLVWAGIAIFEWLDSVPSILLILLLIGSMLLQLRMHYQMPAEDAAKQFNLYAQVVGSIVGVVVGAGTFGVY